MVGQHRRSRLVGRLLAWCIVAGMSACTGERSGPSLSGTGGAGTAGTSVGGTTGAGGATDAGGLAGSGAGGAVRPDAMADLASDRSSSDAAVDRAGNDSVRAGDGAAGGDAVDGRSAVVLAAAPPMGWNSWNTFQCNLDEALIKAVADVFVSSGMQAAGYQYVNLDDCWMDGRDASGNLRWNATKFPAGIPALAAYVHGKGLKLGIYQSANTTTCVGIYGGISPTIAVGSLNHEAQDAQTFAAWGVDFLKYDLCQGNRASFAKMRDGLLATGRPIVYSINPGNGTNDLLPPTAPGWDGVGNTANMWRIGFDIAATWTSVLSLIDQDAPLARFAGPGHWNDPDMLEVGKGLTANEDRSHFTMWAMLAAPLIAGNDLRSMTTATRDILINADVIAVDQDPLGVQGALVATPAANLQVWSRPLAGTNVRAVALFNRTAATASIAVRWTDIGLPAGNAVVRDLWQHAALGTFNGTYSAPAVPSHGVVMLSITGAP
jgi:alpha-galactosidase